MNIPSETGEDRRETGEDRAWVLFGGIWSHAKPLRDTSWWHRRKRERACHGHEWHPETGMGIDWYCCRCGKERDGLP